MPMSKLVIVKASVYLTNMPRAAFSDLVMPGSRQLARNMPRTLACNYMGQQVFEAAHACFTSGLFWKCRNADLCVKLRCYPCNIHQVLHRHVFVNRKYYYALFSILFVELVAQFVF